MNERYALILQRWAAKEILVHEDLYDYRGKETPEVIYDRIYVTADRHLQANAHAFGLPDPMLVFDQDPYPTGAARVTPKVVLTKLSYKIIELLLPHFRDLDETLAQYISDDISLASTKSNMPMAELLMHYTVMMQYYREFGHLVQDKDKVSALYQPPARSSQPSGEVSWSHAREIDADWMSLDQLVTTIIGEYLNEQGQWKKGNLNELEGELSIAFTSVISFFLRATPAGDIYYAEGTH